MKIISNLSPITNKLLSESLKDIKDIYRFRLCLIPIISKFHQHNQGGLKEGLKFWSFYKFQ